MYLGAANAWWHYRNYDTAAGPAFLGWLARKTNILWVPGWGLIYVLHNGPATPLSDFLIPVLSSLLWGWVVVFVVRVIEYAWNHQHWADLTKVSRYRFAAECALVVSIMTCVAGMYLNSDPVYLTGFFASCALIVAVLTLSVYSLFPRPSR